MPTPLYVINLPSCLERRRRMEERVRPFQADFDIRFFPAVDGRALTIAERDRNYDETKALESVDRPLTAGEVGCAMSHRAVYRDLLAANQPCAVVIEDDAVFEADFPEVFRAAQPWLLDTRPRLVLFSRAAKYSAWGRRLTPCRRIHPAWSAAGAFGYALNAAAARAMETYQTPIHTVADCWTDVLRDRVAAVRCIVPYCMDFAEDSRLDSALAASRAVQWEQKDRRTQHRGFWARWRRRLRRMRRRELAKPFLRIRRQPLRG